MKMQIKKSNLVIVVTLVLLIAAIAVIAFVNHGQTSSQGSAGTLTLSAAGEKLREYTISELKAFPAVQVEKNISSGKHEDEQGVFTGIPLERLLDDAIPDWRGQYTEFIFRASDGFVSSVYLSDVEKPENVLVVYAKDGVDLASPEAGGKGPLRIVVAEDPFGNRSAYLLTSIEAK